MAASRGRIWLHMNCRILRNSLSLHNVRLQFCGTNMGSVRMYSQGQDISERNPGTSAEEDFRVLVIPGHTLVEKEKRERRMQKRQVKPPRYKSMPTNQDWTSVWPSAQTFRWSSVPLPLRQGHLKRKSENDGIPPGKYANAELMKIPNFLHLTPNHIRKHCQALKPLCSEWPAGLETDEACEKHFPVQITTRDYVLDGPSVRDPRARLVTMKVKLSSLGLDSHARDKMLRLVGHRYDPDTDTITFDSDRCPMRQQNYDYIQYLLTASYFESWKTEDWESEKAEEDMETYVWEKSQSKPAILRTLQYQKQCAEKGDDENVPEHVSKISSPDVTVEEHIPSVKQYKESMEELNNIGEDIHSLNKYKEAAKSLLLGNLLTKS